LIFVTSPKWQQELDSLDDNIVLGYLKQFGGKINKDQTSDELRSQLQEFIFTRPKVESLQDAVTVSVTEMVAHFLETVGVKKSAKALVDSNKDNLEQMWSRLNSEYYPTVIGTPIRKGTKVLVIAPGFGVVQNPAQLQCLQNAGFNVRNCWKDVEDPENVGFDMDKGKRPILEEIEKFQPDAIICASKGGAYMWSLWQSGQWMGPSVMINLHPHVKECPDNISVVIAHGSRDEVFEKKRKDMEALCRPSTRTYLYYHGSSGLLPSGNCTRYGDQHNMASILQDDCLPRLIDAAISGNGLKSMVSSWRRFLPESRINAEQTLGFHPSKLRQFWQSTEKKGVGDQKLFSVQPGTQEFQCVKTIFKAQSDTPSFYRADQRWPHYEVSKIERIENGRQGENTETMYDNVRRSVANQEATFMGGVHSCWLFHGCSDEDALDSIINDEVVGFRSTLAGSNLGKLWGNGIYFARDAHYPDSHNLCVTTVDGEKKILMCLVVTGLFTQGDPNCSIPPYSFKNHRYHSLVDSVSKPEIFVVPDGAQVYPAYVITYS
jgi:hypothetical protein